MKKLIMIAAAATLLAIGSCDRNTPDGGEAKSAEIGGETLKMENPEYMETQLAKLAPVEIACPEEGLSDGDKKALRKLVAAAAVMDEIFLKQVYARNLEIRAALEQSTAPGAEPARRMFAIHFGPFDRINHNHPFIGDRPKPAGANYYPGDMTKTEFLEHVKVHPDDETAFTSNFTLISRRKGRLVAIPYSEAYATELAKAAALMNEAAEFTENPSLKTFLRSRAAAFKSN
ncbi:MAG: peptidase, partial [Candidatus Aminicenantes bacterium]|nr:peptidase [Candidatus Aminicenantes bacterium]